jgi:succinyl-diaminopimelate desuccinylase
VTLADDLVWLIDIPSPTGGEAALCDAVSERLAAARVPSRRVGRSLVAGEGTGRPLVSLYGHLDTVPEQGNLPARVEGDRVVGLGASDMKAGLAVMIHLLEDDAIRSGPFDVLGVFYDGEEGPAEANGLERVLDEVAELSGSVLAVVLEPTDNELQLGCQGVINARVEFHGMAAHSARPWLGENAISKAGRWLAAMHERRVREVTVGGLAFNETFAVTTAGGGIAANVIPDRFVINLNHRFPPDRSLAEAEQRVIEACAEADLVQIVDRAPPAPVPEDSPPLRRLRTLVGAVAAKTAWTDVARLAARGVPAVNYGPGETVLAHRRDESASIAAMERCRDVLREFLTVSSAEA